MDTFFYVPLQSFTVNRGGPHDVMDLFEATKTEDRPGGYALQFTPGEIEHVITTHGSLDGWLRAPTVDEVP